MGLSLNIAQFVEHFLSFCHYEFVEPILHSSLWCCSSNLRQPKPALYLLVKDSTWVIFIYLLSFFGSMVFFHFSFSHWLQQQCVLVAQFQHLKILLSISDDSKGGGRAYLPFLAQGHLSFHIYDNKEDYFFPCCIQSSQKHLWRL